ncbi:MAG: phosphatidylserine decarboxylase family protein [Phycisphaerales bacterium]|nr:phosphatidylserine decarboxylase family protein [Phycisphaerales bacterium]
MKIHNEGSVTISIALVSVIIICFFTFLICPLLHIWIQWVVLACSFVFLVFIISFFRIPNKDIIKNNNYILAPADGRIVVIEKIENEHMKGTCKQISIFMSPLNVHNNLAPIEGEVTYTQYFPGKFLVASLPKSSTDNEHWTTVFKSPKGTVVCKQIAGFLARRICNYLHTNELVHQGSEFGFIKFGSRVDVLIPEVAVVKIQMNQKVTGGMTVLATW